jgi:hypothetical protein
MKSVGIVLTFGARDLGFIERMLWNRDFKGWTLGFGFWLWLWLWL